MTLDPKKNCKHQFKLERIGNKIKLKMSHNGNSFDANKFCLVRYDDSEQTAIVCMPQKVEERLKDR